MVALPDRLPDLLGCRRHRPVEVRLLPADAVLWRELGWRETIVHGMAWSLSIAQTADGGAATVVDLSWEANALRDLGVDLARDPLVAISIWTDEQAMRRALTCESCLELVGGFDDLVRAHLSAGDPEPDVDAELGELPRLRWNDDPAHIAEVVTADLHRRAILGEALISLGATAGWDLLPRAPVYLECILGLDGSLLIETRRDFAFWRTEVDAERRQLLENAGFTTPDAPDRQFEMLLGPDRTGTSHKDALTRAIDAFLAVYKPKRRTITVNRFEGAGRIDPDAQRTIWATHQRRIDRIARAELYEQCNERLDALGDAVDGMDTVFGLVLDHTDAFAEAVSRAHLDEFLDTVDDLVVLAPVDERVFAGALADPYCTVEDLELLVLRHTFRPGHQHNPLPPVIAGEPADLAAPLHAVEIELLSRDRVLAERRGNTVVRIGGKDVHLEAGRIARNGVIIPISGPIDPPPPPDLLALREPDLG